MKEKSKRRREWQLEGQYTPTSWQWSWMNHDTHMPESPDIVTTWVSVPSQHSDDSRTQLHGRTAVHLQIDVTPPGRPPWLKVLLIAKQHHHHQFNIQHTTNLILFLFKISLYWQLVNVNTGWRLHQNLPLSHANTQSSSWCCRREGYVAEDNRLV